MPMGTTFSTVPRNSWPPTVRSAKASKGSGSSAFKDSLASAL